MDPCCVRASCAWTGTRSLQHCLTLEQPASYSHKALWPNIFASLLGLISGLLWGLNGEKYKVCAETASNNSYPANADCDDRLQGRKSQLIWGEVLGKRGRSCRGPSNGSSAPGSPCSEEQWPQPNHNSSEVRVTQGHQDHPLSVPGAASLGW